MGVLDGIRVLDLSMGMAGPLVGMLLADNGADVIKVEPPSGDPYRQHVAGYLVWLRGRRSITLDLHTPAGQAELRRLAASADVLLETYEEPVAQRLGLDYDTFAAANPRLIWCSIRGYPSNHPDAGRPGWDLLVSARTGLCIEQPPQARPDGEPTFLATNQATYGAAYQAMLGIAAALVARERTGLGQRVETSLFQGVLTMNAWAWITATGPHPVNFFIERILKPDIFQCSDGRWLHVMPITRDPVAWQELTGMAPGGGNPATMAKNQAIAREKFRQHPSDWWMERILALGGLALPVQTTEEALLDDQVAHIGMSVVIDVPGVGPVRQIGLPFQLSKTPGRVGGPPPAPGADNGADWRAPALPPARDTQPDLYAPLHGIQVLDAGQYGAGPYGPMLLANLGASVIKLEPTTGDPMRPSYAFSGCQRGKRAIAVDMKTAEGYRIARQLAAQSDIVYHNFKPGAAESLRFAYHDLIADNPDLIYCHAPAFGNGGPKGDRRGTDQLFQAFCGVEWYGAGADNPPMWQYTGYVDICSGLQGAIACTLALYHRLRTGEGQYVETSLLSGGLFAMSDGFIAPAGAPVRRRPQLDHLQTGFGPLYRLYPTARGWLALVVPDDATFTRLAQAIDRPTLATDPRFASPSAREANATELASILEATFRERPVEDWVARLEAAGVPVENAAGAYGKAGRDFLNDDANVARGLVAAYDHPEYGHLRQFGHLVTFSRMAAVAKLPPPTLGQHTQEILQELGYTNDQIEALRENGIVA